jgi:small subunit ribosomal protein S6
MSQVRQYELIYITPPESTEEALAELHQQVLAVVERFGGAIERTENWGRRRLAYEIGRHREATYVLEVIRGGGDAVAEIDRRLKVSDLVLRHLVVRVDEEQARVERVRVGRAATTARRRTARGLSPERQPGEGQRNDDDGDRDDRSEPGTEARS